MLEILEGLIFAISLEKINLKHCIKDFIHILSDIEWSILYLLWGINVHNVKHAFKYFKFALREIPELIKECSHDFKLFKKTVDSFWNPSKIIFESSLHIFFAFWVITHELRRATDLNEQGNYFELGFVLGEIVIQGNYEDENWAQEIQFQNC